MMLRTIGFAGILAAAVGDARADEPPRASPASPPRLTLVALAEIEYVDVEGAGGFSEREPGLIKPRVRAPYLELDKATLTAGFDLEPRLHATMELRADRVAARIDRLYLDATLVDTPCLSVLLHAGRQKPMAQPHPRRVETYSPLGVAFWKGREWHAGAVVTRHVGAASVRAVASVAMQRDLGEVAMGEDLGLASIGFVNGEVREGSAAELGGLLGVDVRGAYAAAFGFRGALLDNAGSERLTQTFTDDYQVLSGGDTTDLTSHWYGGRAGYEGHGVYLEGEAIAQQLGYLRRRGFELGGSYTLAIGVGGRRLELEPFVRYGTLTVTNLPEHFLVPESWDRRQLVAALLLRPSPSLELKLEYLFLGERTERLADGEAAPAPVRDDELLLQLLITRQLL